MSEVHRWAIGTVVAVVGLIIALLAWLDPQAPASSEKAASASSATPANAVKPKPNVGKLPYAQLRAGDCLTGNMLPETSEQAWPSVFTAVSCRQAHTGEVFFADQTYWKNGPYPGGIAVEEEAETECDRAFESYVGVPYHDSKYTWTDGSVNPELWRAGGRVLFRIAYHPTADYPDGTAMYGSIKDAYE